MQIPSNRTEVGRMVAFNQLLSGLVCLGVPIGLIVLLFKSAARKNATFPASQPRPATPPTLPVPPVRVPHPQVRMGTDGFWLNGDWPVGTALHLHYLIQGTPTDTELIYRPGPEGQFVYTGTTPQSVSAVPVGGSQETTSVLDSTPFAAATPSFLDRTNSIHRDPPIQHQPAAPPFTPGAY